MNFHRPTPAATLAPTPLSGPIAGCPQSAADGGAAAKLYAVVPPHMIATVRNNQLPTSELAELLNAAPAEIDAIRALGHYSGGDLLEPSNGSTWLRAEQAALDMPS